MSKDTENNTKNSNLKEDLVNLAKEIEAGAIENDKLSKFITNEMAEELLILAKEVELGNMTDDELVVFLAKIFRKFGNKRGKSLRKKKKDPKKIIDIIMAHILKSLIKNKMKLNQDKKQNQPGYVVTNLIKDLDIAINSLVSAPRLDSDMNDIRLIEDVIAINQKMAALSGKTSASTKGMSLRLISAMSAMASVSGFKGIGTLSTLQVGVAHESWNDANKINYNSVSGHVDDLPENVESLQEKMQKKFMEKSSTAKEYGPNDVPITEEAKKFKEKRNLEWEHSLEHVRNIEK